MELQNVVYMTPQLSTWGSGTRTHMEPLLIAYSRENPGFSFKDPTHTIKFSQWVVGYVDDDSLIITFRDCRKTEEALFEAQQALISWEKLLQIV